MNITAIVQALWVAAVFSTALVVGQALTQSDDQQPTLFQSAAGGAYDAADQPLPESAITNGEVSGGWRESL